MARSRGWCKMHLHRWEKYGDPGEAAPRRSLNGRTPCAVEGCDLKVQDHGFCRNHSNRWRKYGDPLGGPIWRRNRTPICIVDGCDKPRHGTSVECSTHKRRRVLFGSYDTPPDRRLPDGTRRPYGHGYMRVLHRDHSMADKKGWIQEHRYVMAEFLGRSLTSDENVHHINGVRGDNRLENLELWVTSQPKGQRPSDLVAWSRSIEVQYGSDVDAGRL